MKKKTYLISNKAALDLQEIWLYTLEKWPIEQADRFVGMLGFALLAYFSYEDNKKVEVIIYISLALLFQPFLKVALGRTIWNVVDVIVSAGLIISLFVKPKKV
jgi:hypothetical protein